MTDVGPRVLVIAPSSGESAALVAALAGAGYATSLASTGAAGLRAAQAQRPRALVIGGALPDMDGATLIRKTRLDPMLRALPCVLWMATDDVADEPTALDTGADAIVRSSAGIGVVLGQIAAVLRAAPQTTTAKLRTFSTPRRLLAVDDDPSYLTLLAEALTAIGYQVVLATSGEEALERLSVEAIDCILLDRTMPGLSGLETCWRIKSAPAVRDIPLVMLTGNAGRDATIEALEAGADDFVVKTSELAVLAARVQAQLRRKQFEDEHRRVRERLLRSELAAADERARRESAEARAALAEEVAATARALETANRELEAFSYSVSHDLRAPLRTIRVFTEALGEDLGDQLDDAARDHLRRVLGAAGRMGDLIDALLELARIHRQPVARRRVDVSALAASVRDDLRRREPARVVELSVEPELVATGDERLVRILLDNLLGNAWKFTAKRERAHIAVGSAVRDGERVFFVKDDGVGFDMVHADRLFSAFHRLHTATEYQGTGIGLATVRRIVERHGGRVWAEAEPDRGASFYFTLADG